MKIQSSLSTMGSNQARRKLLKLWRLDMSMKVLDNGNGTTTADISGVRNITGFMQVYDWGEPGMIAKKVFSRMDEE